LIASAADAPSWCAAADCLPVLMVDC